ncbi:MAG: hypothetical protein ACE5I1_19680, partial [bacterium]
MKEFAIEAQFRHICDECQIIWAGMVFLASETKYILSAGSYKDSFRMTIKVRHSQFKRLCITLSLLHRFFH